MYTCTLLWVIASSPGFVTIVYQAMAAAAASKAALTASQAHRSLCDIAELSESPWTTTPLATTTDAVVEAVGGGISEMETGSVVVMIEADMESLGSGSTTTMVTVTVASSVSVLEPGSEMLLESVGGGGGGASEIETVSTTALVDKVDTETSELEMGSMPLVETVDTGTSVASGSTTMVTVTVSTSSVAVVALAVLIGVEIEVEETGATSVVSSMESVA